MQIKILSTFLNDNHKTFKFDTSTFKGRHKIVPLIFFVLSPTAALFCICLRQENFMARFYFLFYFFVNVPKTFDLQTNNITSFTGSKPNPNNSPTIFPVFNQFRALTSGRNNESF
jgi:hypothetical protein